MTAPDKPTAVIAQARSLDERRFIRLAELEWRSRNADRPAYYAAMDVASEAISQRRFVELRDATVAATAGRVADVESQTLAEQAVLWTAISYEVWPKLDRTAQSILGRAWRTLGKEITETY